MRNKLMIMEIRQIMIDPDKIGENVSFFLFSKD